MGDLAFLHVRLTALLSSLSPSSLNTCPAKVNTFGRKVNTSGQKLNTSGQKLNTSAPKLNTLPPPTEHIPSRAHPPPPALRAPSPPFMVSLSNYIPPVVSLAWGRGSEPAPACPGLDPGGPIRGEETSGQPPHPAPSSSRGALLFTLSEGRETFAKLPWPSDSGLLFLPRPLGEGWGEGLPGNQPGVTQRSQGRGRACPELAECGEGSSGRAPRPHRDIKTTH